MNFEVKKANIFKNEKDGKTWYTMSIAQKDKDGKFQNFSEFVKFHKCDEIVGLISEVKGFISYFKKDEKIYRFFYITEYKNANPF